MSRETDRAEALRAEFVRALVGETGMREVMALPIADSLVAYLQREYPGEKLYIPQPVRTHPVEQIETALREGAAPGAVCMRFGVSIRTLRRMFPGGLPKPPEQTDAA